MKQYTKDLRETFIAWKKPLIIFLAVLTVLCLTGMMLATIFDLQISQALNNRSQWFSKFFGDYGEFPAYVINVGFFVALSVWLFRNKKYYWCTIPLIAAAVFGYMFADKYFESTSLPVLFNALFNVLFIAGIFVFLFLIPKELFNKFFFILLVAFVISTITNAVILFFKTVWGRVRFHDLAEGSTNFTPWFKPNGINGNKSFFSGHVNTACCLAVLWFVPTVFKIKNRFAVALCLIIPLLYSGLMMYARIVVGAHYLSDTVFAVMNFAVWTVIIMKVLCHEPKSKVLSNTDKNVTLP